MKLTPVKVSKLLSNLGDYITHRNESEIVNVNACFDDLFESVELNVDKALGLSAMKNSIDSHLHVGAFRKLPEETISKRSLPVTAATTPWHNLLDNRYELRESERPQNVVNSALKKLDVPYQVATRIRHMTAYRPSNQKGEDPTPVEDSSFTDEELVFQDSAGVPHPIQSLGSGIGVIVPVVVALSATDTELLSIEEPESHVHPRLQAELGDIVITAASGKQKRTLLIETHSEYLILRILKRIRETTLGKLPEDSLFLSKDEVAVLYVIPPSEGSFEGSTVIELPVTHDGDFSRAWPSGFFTERSKELY